MKTLLIAAFSGALLAMSPASAAAVPITVPPGLAPGSTYFLAFVTANGTDALSTDITTYDAFVTAEANLSPELAALATTWRVIGSTAAVDAVTHVAITGPVFGLDGVQIATGAADLFDGSIASPVNVNQFGAGTPFAIVWTGSLANGTSFIPAEALGGILPGIGVNTVSNSAWLQAGIFPPAEIHLLYAVSGPLIVPETPVPEPATLMLMIGPAFAFLRRRRAAARSRQTGPAA
jgi:hypothetical protein